MRVFEISIDFNPTFATLKPTNPDKLKVKKNEKIEFIWDSWDIKDNKIENFVPSFGFTICTEQIKDLLNKEFDGLKFNLVKIVKSPKELKSKNLNALKWLPAKYPALFVVSATKEATILPQSSVTYDEDGSIEEIEGISERMGEKIIPRKKGKGLFFSKDEVGNYQVFNAKKTNLLLCTEEVKTFFVQNKLNNVVDILEIGDIV